jgi:hypothetical protein
MKRKKARYFWKDLFHFSEGKNTQHTGALSVLEDMCRDHSAAHRRK